DRADVILLLVSRSFMDSEYIWTVELRRALERHERGTASVVPIIASPVHWSTAPFAKFEVLPDSGKAVTQYADRDEVWADIVTRIARLVQEVTAEKNLKSDAVSGGLYVWIPPGSFTMGVGTRDKEPGFLQRAGIALVGHTQPSETPAHQVTITKGF